MRQKVKNSTSVVLLVYLFSMTSTESSDALRPLKETVVVPVCVDTPRSDFIIQKWESNTKRLVVRGLHCWVT